MADTLALGASAERRGGSSPSEAILEKIMKVYIDITAEDVIEDTDDVSYVFENGDDSEQFLNIGNLKIKITEEQADRIRYYYENT